MLKPFFQSKVAIIILNWNGLEDTIACLESLKSLDYPNLEIFVIDNGSARNEAVLLRRTFGNFIKTIRCDTNLGFAKGSNVGIKAALREGADYVLLLNNDTVVSPDFLGKMICAAESTENCGLVSPVIYYFGTNRIQFRGRTMLGRFSSFKTAYKGNVLFTEVLLGACFLIPTNLINNIGLIPEDYFLQGEDIDYSMRSLKSGRKNLVVLDAKIWHKSFRSFKKLGSVASEYSLMNELIVRFKYSSKFQFLLWLLFASIFFVPLQMRFFPSSDTIINCTKGLFKGLKACVLEHRGN